MVALAFIDDDGKDEVIKGSRFIDTRPAAAEVATAGAGTYTAAQILGGIILRDCAGGSRTDTLPTAALLVAAMDQPRVGEIIRCLVINASDAAETITIAAGTGGAFNDLQQATSKDIAQNASKELVIRITGVLAGSAAYVLYM